MVFNFMANLQACNMQKIITKSKEPQKRAYDVPNSWNVKALR